MGDETVRITSSTRGFHIFGNTAIAVRNGAYRLLDKYGVRWFFKHSDWTVTPSSLANIGVFDNTEDPDMAYRMPVHESQDSVSVLETWFKRNLLPGRDFYPANHSYTTIAPVSSYYVANPEWYTGDVSTTDWQLDTAAGLIARATEYASTFLDTTSGDATIYGCADTLTRKGAPIVPNDGGGWAPPYDESDTTSITNIVFSLANQVATNLQATHSGKYATTLDYYIHAGIPTIPLSSYVMAWITDGYNYTPNSTADRYVGLNAKGVKIGTYQYLAEWLSTLDIPCLPKVYDQLRVLDYYHDNGSTCWLSDAADGWGGYGLLMWLMGKLTWDTDSNYWGLLEDFYDKSFGDSASSMRSVFENMYTDNYSMKQAFTDLDNAETVASGDAAALNRIRQIQSYAYFTWKWHNLGLTNLSNADLEAFYTFCCKIRYWYLVYYKYVTAESATGYNSIYEELTTRGYSSTDIIALQDFTEPTASQVSAWKTEAINYFSSVSAEALVQHINPRRYNLHNVNDLTTATVGPMYISDAEILIPSSGNETVTVKVKGVGYVKWFDPRGLFLDLQYANNSASYVDMDFTASEAGTYTFMTARSRLDSFLGYVDIQNRTAGILAARDARIFTADENLTRNAPTYWFANEAYFYVPSGTANFQIGADITLSYLPSATLTDPASTDYVFNWASTEEMTVSSPVSGLWHLGINKPSREGQFWFVGIPPLVWHDPQYLATTSNLIAAPSVTPATVSGTSQVCNNICKLSSGSAIDEAATELKTYLDLMTGGSASIVVGDISGPAIRLQEAGEEQSMAQISVAASADDTTTYWNGTAWAVYGIDTLARAGYQNSTNQKQGTGLRFVGVNIPAGASINSAVITFVAGNTDSATTVNTGICGELSANAASFSDIANYQARRGTDAGGADNTQRTTARVAWDNIAAWTIGTSYDSPDISSVLQEIVNTVGAITNLGLFWDDHDDRSTHTTATRRAASWDNATYDPPLLTLTYTATGLAALSGKIGSVTIYKRAISATEVQRHFLTTKWKF